MPPRLSIQTPDDPPSSAGMGSGKGKGNTPLLALAPTIMEEEQTYFPGQPEQAGISEVWNGESVTGRESIFIADTQSSQRLPHWSRTVTGWRIWRGGTGASRDGSMPIPL